MSVQELLEYIVFSFGDYSITVGNIILALLSLFAVLFLQRIVLSKVLPKVFDYFSIEKRLRRRIYRKLNYCFIFGAITITILVLGTDYVLYSGGATSLKASYITGTLLILQLARLADLLVSKILVPRFIDQRKKDGFIAQSTRRTTIRGATLQYVVYALAIIVFLNIFDINYELFSVNLQGENPIPIRISNIIWAFLIFIIARLILWLLTNVLLDSFYQRKEINIGSQFAINQLFTYVIYILAGLYILETVGFSLTKVWAGAAALLIGVGLGLQQTFNDFFSGILLLFERTTEVGDVVELSNGLIGTVQKIGLRVSFIQTFDNRTVIVPNSELVINDVTNWSHNDERARFFVGVGVAYGSNTEMVKTLLMEVAAEHPKVIKFPAPFVRFVNFGDSSLDFELHFWSQALVQIDNVKSDLRFEIDKKFRANSIEIPFPQMDLWIKNNVVINKEASNGDVNPT
ncbi:MAG: mechanosensitive ion channel domain-containing protein [Bacteroidota bacterium]